MLPLLASLAADQQRLFIAYLARAIRSGRSAFNQGVVPRCFLRQFNLIIAGSWIIVMDCSSRPFCQKMQKSSPILPKTIKQLSTGPPG
jgi:hypothetical protein